jgi:hypothetical protein
VVSNALKIHINHAIKDYTEAKIAAEVAKNIEDVVFFSSYTVGASIFRKATNKLKKKLKEKDFSELFLWKDEALNVIAFYTLPIQEEQTETFEYLLLSLMKAQIKINEAVLFHFATLHTKAHNNDYLERRIEQIHALLFE